jgi:broad specificity phosphatase PhoE
MVRRIMRRRAILAAPLLALRPAQASGAPALIAALKAGGVVAVMRHAITDRSQLDTGDLTSRAGQRNLSAAGRAQAVAVGLAMTRLRIPLGEVLTSPVFRALDTADLAFGARRVVEPLLTADDYIADPAFLRRSIAWIGERVRRPSAPGVSDILVGHIVPLGMVLGRALGQAEYPEGSFAIFGEAGLRGILPAETLIAA